LAEAPEFLDLVDAVLVISTHEDARLDRLVARGMPEGEAERRMACQASDAERRDIADYVIENDGSEVSFRVALADFWDAEVTPRVA
jgi:dephospho-CoA kinase